MSDQASPVETILLTGFPSYLARRVGLEILRAKRTAHFGRERPFATRTHHVELADTRHGVGVSELKRIDLVKLGDKEGLLLPG